MGSIILPHRMRYQPQGSPVLDLGNPLMQGIFDIFLPSAPRGLVRAFPVTPSTSPTGVRGGQQGFCWQVPATNLSGYHLGQMGVMKDNGAFGQDCTIFIYRRSLDTTARLSQLFGSPNITTNRILISAPLNDGLCYWDYGNTTTGRLTVAITKNPLVPDAMVFVAGAVKGREIWRNGIKIASNANTFSPVTSTFLVGIGSANASLASDNEEIYMVGIVMRSWSDAECREWSANPYGIFKQYERMWVPGSLTVGGANRPRVFIAS